MQNEQNNYEYLKRIIFFIVFTPVGIAQGKSEERIARPPIRHVNDLQRTTMPDLEKGQHKARNMGLL